MSTIPRALLLVLALVLAACSANDEDTDPVQLESSESVDDDAGDSAGDVDPEERSSDDSEAEPAAADGDLVDLTEAVPGTWPVGDAGTVTFAIDGGALVLEDVTAADGWSAEIEVEDADEIEVDLRRGEVEWQIEVELTDGGETLEVEIDQDVEAADEGSYDIGDAGTFAFEVRDGRLVLTDLSVADGWTVAERVEEAEEIDLEVRDGARRFDVEVELDDGEVEVEIDYEVRGPVPA